jgi:hypothetical protein
MRSDSLNVQFAPSGVYRHYYTWFLWKVLAPYGFLIVIWLAYSVKEMNAPFAAAFAHGEMLVFAAVLLIEVSFEGEELRGKDSPFDFWFDVALPFFKFGAMFVICLFGFFRYDVIALNGNAGTGTGVTAVRAADEQLFAYAVFNVTVASTAVLVAVFACVKHCEHEMQKRWALLTTS